jgi:hypothetical protein
MILFSFAFIELTLLVVVLIVVREARARRQRQREGKRAHAGTNMGREALRQLRELRLYNGYTVPMPCLCHARRPFTQRAWDRFSTGPDHKRRAVIWLLKRESCSWLLTG